MDVIAETRRKELSYHTGHDAELTMHENNADVSSMHLFVTAAATVMLEKESSALSPLADVST